MSLEDDFKNAKERSQSLPAQPPNVLLKLYGLYKQATTGDVQGKRPGMLDMRGRAKYDAWSERSGMTQDAAMESYIKEIDTLEG